MKTLKEQIEVMQHFLNGGDIEFQLGFNAWALDKDPSWNWTDIDYRIAPPFVSYYKNLARFNSYSTYSNWWVQLSNHYGQISARWEEEDEPECDGCLPSEILDLIEERVNSHMLNTGREKQKETIKNMREHIKELDILWLKHEIEFHESKILDLKDQLKDLEE
jgi:hypothetical protein